MPAVIFDLDGVITDTAELHYQSWRAIANELGIPFDHQANNALRGLSRPQSLEKLLGPRSGDFTPAQKHDLLARKNDDYLARVAGMSERDLLPGVEPLLRSLRDARIPMAIGSSSKNATFVLERLGVTSYFEAVVDGLAAPNSKPHPEVFLLAARRLGVPPAGCVVIEDAEAGVAAAKAAKMRVIGVGPAERVGGADVITPTIAALDTQTVLSLFPARSAGPNR
ncbi:MAG: beta-phosphoglucomutase [Phycisphaerales bacterium]|nr:beta-phosphoglucomutase [Phycisphaerales bacterium]